MAHPLDAAHGGEGTGVLILEGDLPPITDRDGARIAPLAQEAQAHAYFSYVIPYVPDALSSPHLAGRSEMERLAEATERHARLVTALGAWREREVGFALRYLWVPHYATVRVSMVARVPLGDRMRVDEAESVAAGISALMRGFDVPVERVMGQHNITDHLRPIQSPIIAEVRQRELVVPLGGRDAYVVYPFPVGEGAFLRPFHALVNETVPCLISIYLQPTPLLPFEYREYAEVARGAELFASLPFSMFTIHGNRPDPMARHVAALYGDYVRRLTAPYMVLVQVAAEREETTRAIAYALRADVSAQERPDAREGRDAMPRDVDVLFPDTDCARAAARASLARVALYPWGSCPVSVPKRRLPYLTDARTAAAVFRFPIGLGGGVPGVRSRQKPPSFEVGARSAAAGPREVVLGRHLDGHGLAVTPLDYLTHHILVGGTIGYGKTTTVMHLLAQLWARGIASLVIEPAKVEYRALLRAPFGADVRVFTLGDETTSPFRLNILEILPGVRVEAHISLVEGCFQAAVPQFGILPSLIGESLHRIYTRCGWELSDTGDASDNRQMPTLGDLYAEILRVVDERGYSQNRDDIRAAASGRIGTLLRGSKGRMLNTRRSIPLADLLATPTILELDALNAEERELVTLFLLTMIREHCAVTRTAPGLHHLIVLEEANRLANAHQQHVDRETSSDTKAEVAQIISEALREMRALGEGILLATQIPSLLAPEARGAANIKIVHRLPSKADRDAVGETMNMTAAQNDYLGVMEKGVAALFTEGYEHPTFVSVPNYRQDHGLPSHLGGDVVREAMRAFHTKRGDASLPFTACGFCRARCRHRDRVGLLAYTPAAQTAFAAAHREALDAMDAEAYDEGWAALAGACADAVAPLDGDADAAYCFFAHVWRGDCTEGLAGALHEFLDRERDGR